jgi:hypothetical protein
VSIRVEDELAQVIVAKCTCNNLETDKPGTHMTMWKNCFQKIDRAEVGDLIRCDLAAIEDRYDVAEARRHNSDDIFLAVMRK